MLRGKFYEEVCDVPTLQSFCNDYGYRLDVQIIDNEQLNDRYDEQIVNMAQNAGSWQDLRDELDNIDDGWDYYCIDDYDNPYPLTDSRLDAILDSAYEWASVNGIWDDDNEFEPSTEGTETTFDASLLFSLASYSNK